MGLSVTSGVLDQFEVFEDNLYAANEVMNLTRIPREEAWQRHFVDSLLFQDLIPLGSVVLDIGTGPGFPAWPLAVVRVDLQVVGLDSSGKMLGFLSQNPLPNLKTVQARAEEWEMRESFDVVTGRAVAPLAAQLELSAAFCKVGGRVLPMRTPAEREQVEGDFSSLGLKLEEVVERALPGTDVVRLSPIFNKVGQTPQRFPRPWSEIKRSPIL